MRSSYFYLKVLICPRRLDEPWWVDSGRVLFDGDTLLASSLAAIYNYYIDGANIITSNTAADMTSYFFFLGS